ncbi:NADP-dependent phosphogluconate dehydrogenase [Candidatus Pacearchaeota archaeon]|nr:NADP-dependent phosphogluconate dehydrogenase [Candidatus Pacearchaeota archaeon]
MKIGFIGLGRMGFNMVERLLKHKHEVVVWNRSSDKTNEIAKKGAIPSYDLDEFLSKLGEQKIVWLMLPAGEATNDMIKILLKKLKKEDILIDGANDFYKNTERHDKMCSKKGVHFFDIGVSGGVHGLDNGYTLMVGGEKEMFNKIEPFCKSLAPEKGYGYFGEAGSGHFVKSVHNIIEYVYLQGIAEGVELLDKKNIDIKKALEVWGPASVVSSWLIDLAEVAVKRNDFNEISPNISSVTIKELNNTKKSVKGYAPAFDVATKIRKSSMNKEDKKFLLGKKTIAAIRREFGRHEVRKK